MKIEIGAAALLIMQICLIMFSVSVINDVSSTEGVKLFHSGLIIFNIIFGAMNIRTIFSR